MLFRLAILSLLVSTALPLECYVCSTSSTNEECNQSQRECPTTQDTCMTAVDILGLEKAIVKQCASQATCSGAAASASTDANGNGNIVNCCNTFDLCNFSGAKSVHIHKALMILSAGLMFLLLSH